MNEELKPFKRRQFIGWILAMSLNMFIFYRFGWPVASLSGVISAISYFSGIQEGVVITTSKMKEWLDEA